MMEDVRIRMMIAIGVFIAAAFVLGIVTGVLTG